MSLPTWSWISSLRSSLSGSLSPATQGRDASGSGPAFGQTSAQSAARRFTGREPAQRLVGREFACGIGEARRIGARPLLAKAFRELRDALCVGEIVSMAARRSWPAADVGSCITSVSTGVAAVQGAVDHGTRRSTEACLHAHAGAGARAHGVGAPGQQGQAQGLARRSGRLVNSVSFWPKSDGDEWPVPGGDEFVGECSDRRVCRRFHNSLCAMPIAPRAPCRSLLGSSLTLSANGCWPPTSASGRSFALGRLSG